MMEPFCKFFQLTIDIWQGPNAFELVNMSYYKGVRLGWPGYLSVVNVLENKWLSLKIYHFVGFLYWAKQNFKYDCEK